MHWAYADDTPSYVEAPSPVPGEAHVTADQINGEMNSVLKARGDVVVTRDDQKLTSDWLDYYQAKDNVKAGNHFTLTRQHDRIDGTTIDYNLGSRTGTGQQPVFTSMTPAVPATENTPGVPAKQFRGDGQSVEFRGKDNYRVFDSEATTCSVGDDSWYLRSSKLDLDYVTGIGTAYDAHVVFKGVPLLYTPWLDFSLDGRRKSGFLYPSLKGGSNGFEFAIPYYWNIAPNYDATLTTHINEKHGLILAGEFRYLEPSYSGTLYTEQVPDDQTTGHYRYLWSGSHQQTLAPGLTFGYDGTTVSDNNYFSDFGDRYSIAASTNLMREAWVNYGTSWTTGNASANVLWQRYQTLEPSDSATYTVPPYALLPQISVNANQALPDGLSANLFTQITQFSHPTLQEGKRMVFYPSISLPFERSWGYFRPKVGLQYTEYQLDPYDGSTAQDITRSLPIASIDTGLHFERQTEMFGASRTQTLEPRLYYLYVPARDQSNIPNFDSSLNDFGFAQIFSENDYSGYDRISPANQITGALTTQLFDNDTGREIIRAAIGQRFYFNSQQLNADGTLSDRTTGSSDFLASLGGEVVRNWNLDSFYEYSATTHSPEQYNVSLNYQPAQGKVVSLRYRYLVDGTIDEYGNTENQHMVDLGVQWPVTKQVYGLARTEYSLQDRQMMEQLLGVEYNAGCWILRLVGERYITNLTETKTSFWVQLELNGLGSLGSDPFSTLSLSIPGYSKTNDIQP